MKEGSTLKILEKEAREQILAKLKSGKIVTVDEEGNISFFKHEFEYVGWSNVHRCKYCGKEVAIGDMRIFRSVEAKKLANDLTILNKNDFLDWESKEVEDFKALVNGATDLVSTGRVEAAYNEIRYGRACKPNKLRI